MLLAVIVAEEEEAPDEVRAVRDGAVVEFVFVVFVDAVVMAGAIAEEGFCKGFCRGRVAAMTTISLLSSADADAAGFLFIAIAARMPILSGLPFATGPVAAREAAAGVARTVGGFVAVDNVGRGAAAVTAGAISLFRDLTVVAADVDEDDVTTLVETGAEGADVDVIAAEFGIGGSTGAACSRRCLRMEGSTVLRSRSATLLQLRRRRK